MGKFHHCAVIFLKYAFPVVVVAEILSMKGYNNNTLLFQMIGLTTIAWTALLIYFFFAVVFSEKLKNSFVRKLAGIHENDEREFQITGVVSKKTFIATTAMFVLLLFLSAIHINIYRASETEVKSGNRGTIEIGAGFSFLESEKSESPKPAGRVYFVKYNGLPLSADGTLLLVMALQLGIFYYFSRRENKIT